MAATRYMRYTVVAAVCLIIVVFLSTSSAPQQGLRTAQERLNEWRNKQWQDKDEQYPVADGVETDGTTGEDTEDVDGERDTSSKSTEWLMPPPLRKRPPGVAGKMNATFVTLARNSDLSDISESIMEIELRFNQRFNYDWVFLNDEPFDNEFKKRTTALVSGKTKYATIAEQHWSFPSWIDQEKAADVREQMKAKEIIYGDSISYRHMCRFESGFFFQEPLLKEYEWYWRVEPSIKLLCDVDFDVFKFMHDHNKMYGHTINLYEYLSTIPTLWATVNKFMKIHPEHVAPNNSMDFISDDGGKTYNLCHFWSNFEIGNLEWLRSKAYTDYFNHLDRQGGFFYERWGDAPVHSIAAALMLPKDAIHLFEDISYYHVPFTHCPNKEKTRLKKRCVCKPEDSFDWNGYSCMRRFYKLHDWALPEGVSWNP